METSCILDLMYKENMKSEIGNWKLETGKEKSERGNRKGPREKTLREKTFACNSNSTSN